MDDIKLNNHKKKRPEEVRSCPKCGAPLLSEVCQYCGTYIGEVATGDLTAEYPMIPCRLCKLTIWNTIFPLGFVVGFLGMPLCMYAILDEVDMDFKVSLFFIPFLLVGFGFLLSFLWSMFNVLSVTFFGKVLEGTVYGYMDDTVAYNGVNGQKIKILVHARGGYKFILLPLGTTEKPYKVNKKVYVKVFRDRARIVYRKEDLQW